ncbi:hypothetical protein F2P44_33735 [Massilia sp. CCM 8695]|uniref:Uncharacterized protein n=1 Tax=Massilia frigida TaxID=2609281 RepID=A0ABX0NKN6_9BURK|nr:hypothetical protein [Massilia frigida]NHZ84172.1 hypothetical protein [Massilia frigida]
MLPSSATFSQYNKYILLDEIMEIVGNQICVPGVTIRSAQFLALSLVVALAGCFPVAVDDFSVLGYDVLSDILRKSYSDVNSHPGAQQRFHRRW